MENTIEGGQPFPNTMVSNRTNNQRGFGVRITHAAGRQVIEYSDGVAFVYKQIDYVAANKPQATSDKCVICHRTI